MPFRAPLVLFVAFAICASLAEAQAVGGTFQGTFTGTVPNGEAVVTFSVGERVAGTLTGPGVAIDLVGDLDPIAGVVRGVASAAAESVHFEATLRADLLTLTLFDVDADGRPLPDTAVALELRRARARNAGATAPGGRAAGLPSKAQPAQAEGVATLTPDLVQAVHDAVNEAMTLPESLMELAIDAALEAGRLSQRGIALAGTLSQRSDGTLRFSRDASDALRIDLLDGSTFTIVFHGAPQGNADEDGSGFVEDPHILDIHVSGQAEDRPIDLRVTYPPVAGRHARRAAERSLRSRERALGGRGAARAVGAIRLRRHRRRRSRWSWTSTVRR